MSIDIKSFTSRLAEIGVIDNKLKAHLVEITEKSYKDPRFPDIVGQMLESVSEWHDIAKEIRYSTDPMLAKTISDGVKLVFKFAKSNVSVYNIKMSQVDDCSKKLTEMGQAIYSIKQKSDITIESGNTNNIRIETIGILKTYIDAVKQQRSTIDESDEYTLNIVDLAISKLDNIKNTVSSVVDTGSKDAAIRQTELFNSINSWEHAFAYGNFDRNALADLDKALVSANAWALIPLNLKSKPAKEGDYVHADVIGTRMQDLATTFDAIAKINQAIHLIERAKLTHLKMTDTARLEAQKAENLKEIEDMQARANEIRRLVAAKQMDVKSAFTEMEYIEKKMLPSLQKSNQNLDSQIMGMKQRKTNLRMTVTQIENVCHNFLAYKDDPSIINLFAKYVNFQALTNFLGGTKIDSSINDIVNLAAIEKITQQKFDESIKVFDDRLEEEMNLLDPVNIFEDPNVSKNEMSEEEMLRAIMGGVAVEENVQQQNENIPYIDFNFGKSSLSEDEG